MPGTFDASQTLAQSFAQSGVNFTTLGYDASFYNNTGCASSTGLFSHGDNYPDWVTGSNGKVDLRAVYVQCCPNSATNTNASYCPQFTWPTNVHYSKSPTTKLPVAFTTEAVFYAQSGYFVTIVMIQWSNVFACKSRKVLFLSFR